MKNKHKPYKNISRLKILSDVLSIPSLSYRRWDTPEVRNNRAVVGDLVSLSCQNPSNWYLSWVVQVGDSDYILESVETGELCRWYNISINIYDRVRIESNPSWRWTDKQHKLNNRWLKVCNLWNAAYLCRPMDIEYTDTGCVFKVYKLFDRGNIKSKNITNWKNITMKEMDKIYKKLEADLNM